MTTFTAYSFLYNRELHAIYNRVNKQWESLNKTYTSVEIHSNTLWSNHLQEFKDMLKEPYVEAISLRKDGLDDTSIFNDDIENVEVTIALTPNERDLYGVYINTSDKHLSSDIHLELINQIESYVKPSKFGKFIEKNQFASIGRSNDDAIKRLYLEQVYSLIGGLEIVAQHVVQDLMNVLDVNLCFDELKRNPELIIIEGKDFTNFYKNNR